MDVIFIFIFLLYFLLLIALIIGWLKAINGVSQNEVGKENLISVIIPVRNEQGNVASLITDLKLQIYYTFEAIFVDDHSDDETHTLVTALINDDERFSIVRSIGHGKKEALACGMNFAKGSIVVTTDADCCVGPEWLSCINQYFQNKDLMMAFGGVRVTEDGTLFSSLQSIEFSSLIGTGAATNALGFPTMCNGANLAIRKKVLFEVGAYDDNIHIPSGDDEFLLRKVNNKYPGGVCFISANEAIVSTKALSGLDTFVQQRIRWAGKWRHHDTMGSKALAIGIILFQVSFISIFTLGLSGLISLEVFLSLLTVKILMECFFLKQVTQFLKVKWNWISFIILQFLYPLYVVFIGVKAHFQPFIWKGRTWKSIRTKVGVIADND